MTATKTPPNKHTSFANFSSDTVSEKVLRRKLTRLDRIYVKIAYCSMKCLGLAFHWISEQSLMKSMRKQKSFPICSNRDLLKNCAEAVISITAASKQAAISPLDAGIFWVTIPSGWTQEPGNCAHRVWPHNVSWILLAQCSVLTQWSEMAWLIIIRIFIISGMRHIRDTN